MNAVDDARAVLRGLSGSERLAYLRTHSGLPGPRANLTLAAAFAEEARDDEVRSLLTSDEEYLRFCGTVALGPRLAEAPSPEVLAHLRRDATDDRWRIREGVAIALQRVGDDNPDRLRSIVLDWASDPDPLVLRAAAAAICEPRLITDPAGAAVALEVCRRATATVASWPATQRRGPKLRVLRQGLGYCWSVAVAADPQQGLPAFAQLEQQAATDADVAWIVRENRRKKRLSRLL